MCTRRSSNGETLKLKGFIPRGWGGGGGGGKMMAEVAPSGNLKFLCWKKQNKSKNIHLVSSYFFHDCTGNIFTTPVLAVSKNYSTTIYLVLLLSFVRRIIQSIIYLHTNGTKFIHGILHIMSIPNHRPSKRWSSLTLSDEQLHNNYGLKL